MTRFLRSAAFRLALGYVAVSIAVLVLCAAPLWCAWRQNVEQVRTELLREDVKSLTDTFEDQGPGVLAAVIAARVRSQRVANSIILFTDPKRAPLAELRSRLEELAVAPSRSRGDVRSDRRRGRGRRVLAAASPPARRAPRPYTPRDAAPA